MLIKTFFLLCCVFLLGSCASTGSYLVNVFAKLGNYQKVEDVNYDAVNKMDIYIPDAVSGEIKAPVIVFFYGGCWGACQSAFKSDYEFLADALTETGYVVVIPDYRYYPEVKFQTIISDAAHATQWVQNNISQYKGDDQNIFLMGHSAGAHLAIMLSVKEDYLNPETYSSIKGGIGLAGPYDFIPYTESYLPGVFGPESEAAYSQPVNFIQGNEPPLLLMYGEKDTAVKPKNIISLTKKIEEKNGKVKAVYYKDMDHIEIMTGFTRPLRNQKLVDDVDSFIKTLNSKKSDWANL